MYFLLDDDSLVIKESEKIGFMNIVLMGYMGCGKSKVGNCLASRLAMEYLDLDAYIEGKEGCTISQLFSEKGELYFRKKERACLIECLKTKQNTILALGGGTPCFSGNIEVITKTQDIQSVYLKTGIPILVERLFEERKKRPLIAHLETKDLLADFIGKHLFERSCYYHQAMYSVTTDYKTPTRIAEELVNCL